MSNLLDGVRVIELGTHVAIPKAARLLADWGAEVIKIEPLGGEAWRTIALSYGIPFAPDNNPIFQAPNANKKSIALDLKSAEGKGVMLDLLETADIFLTNTRMKSLEKLGLDYDSLKTQFPKLIYAHFTGYGAEGPDKDRPGFDIAAYWSRAGMPVEWATQETAPFRPMPGFGDSTVASMILSGVLAALYHRTNSEQGDFIQTSLYGCALWYNSCGVVATQPQYNFSYPRSRYDQTAPYNAIFKTKDGTPFTFSIPYWDKISRSFLTAIHLEAYVDDPRFKTLSGAKKNMKDVMVALDEAFGKMDLAELRQMFKELDVVYEELTNPSNVTKDEQAWANGYLTQATMENGESVVLAANPLSFENAQTRDFSLAPQLGADTVPILEDLGYDEEYIRTLSEQKVVGIQQTASAVAGEALRMAR